MFRDLLLVPGQRDLVRDLSKAERDLALGKSPFGPGIVGAQFDVAHRRLVADDLVVVVDLYLIVVVEFHIRHAFHVDYR